MIKILLMQLFYGEKQFLVNIVNNEFLLAINGFLITSTEALSISQEAC